MDPARVLVEDDPDDVLSVERLMSKGRLPVRLTVARDGHEALRLLGGRLPPAPRPELVLLDVGLPAMSGLELLQIMRNDRALREVPVVVVSGLAEDRHVRQGMQLGVQGHVVKPLRFHDFVWMVRTVQRYRARLALLARLDEDRRRC
jgi:CheY-like chemotaxis protein